MNLQDWHHSSEMFLTCGPHQTMSSTLSFLVINVRLLRSPTTQTDYFVIDITSLLLLTASYFSPAHPSVAKLAISPAFISGVKEALACQLIGLIITSMWVFLDPLMLKCLFMVRIHLSVYGITVLQTYIYFRRYTKDRIYVKLVVSGRASSQSSLAETNALSDWSFVVSPPLCASLKSVFYS